MIGFTKGVNETKATSSFLLESSLPSQNPDTLSPTRPDLSVAGIPGLISSLWAGHKGLQGHSSPQQDPHLWKVAQIVSFLEDLEGLTPIQF